MAISRIKRVGRTARCLLLQACLALTSAEIFSADTAPAVPAWRLVWADEFDVGNRPDPSRWVYDLGGGGWGNNELQTYTSRTNNVRVQDGLLVIEAIKEPLTGGDGIRREYTSGRIKTLGRASWKFGRFEARMKLPRGQGIWPAFWAMGTNFTSVGWPRCGEIDIMENIGREPRTVHGTIHGPGYSGGDGISGNRRMTADLADGFHVYAVEWDSRRIRWFIDHQVFFQTTPVALPAGASWVFDGSFFLLLNLAVGGNWPGVPDRSTTFPQRVEVDYVRVYEPSTPAAELLRLDRSIGHVQVRWPAAFPQARLERASGLGEPWELMPLTGEKAGGEFFAEITPGVYRLRQAY